MAALSPNAVTQQADDKSSQVDTEYERAVMVLNDVSLNVGKNKPGDAGRKSIKIDLIRNGLQRIDMKLGEIDGLSVVHVAGTKGKGSTCAYVERILREHGYKTGIFSSPHLIEARERIRINGHPVDKVVFTNAFWHVYGKLIASKAEHDGKMLGYFGVTFLMALYIFSRVEKVDVAIVEVGVGGQYDATNALRKPVVCGITSMGLDHTHVLGNTVHEITWHKAGIFKKGVPAVTVPQRCESVMEIMFQRAQEKQCPLFIAPPLRDSSLEQGCCWGIGGGKQPYNAALAVWLARIWLHNKNPDQYEMAELQQPWVTAKSAVELPSLHSTHLSTHAISGLAKCRLPGRAQVLRKPGITYYLDGAHTTDSMEQCVQWFKETAEAEQREITGKVVRALVFRMKENKPAQAHLMYLKDCGFHLAAFCPHLVSWTARNDFPDSMDIRQDSGKAQEIAADQLKDWEKVFSAVDSNPDLQAEGDGGRGPRCVSACFPSTVSALWWASLMREQTVVRGQRTVATLARADLEEEGARRGEGGGAAVPDLDEVKDAVHVQVLVTGSLIMVGGALTLLHSHSSIWE